MSPSTKGIFIDATLGLGGHSERLLEENPALEIIGIDKDKISLDFARQRLARFGRRFSAVQGSFSQKLGEILRSGRKIIGVLADLGISSPQVDNLERGFSVKSPILDMRMDLDASLDAKYILNNYPKDELERVFRDFGEIKGATKLANLIAESRKKKQIISSEDLCQIAESFMRFKGKIHPATLIFQALRIEVNDELGELRDFLAQLQSLSGAKIAIISFHSLEDRMVKTAFKSWSADCICDESALKCECGGKNAKGEIITKKPITPSADEITRNPRARSAKMRCFRFYEKR
ncbi:16S rRNA (cytosine(1402)-N(4))-methyltransferase RsmH [Helicobacter sp. 23-1045]